MAKEKKIGLLNAGAMTVVAVLFDILSFIPYLNILTGILAWTIFTIWFFILGFGFINIRRFGIMLASLATEVTPFASMLPTLTVGVVAMILMINWKSKVPGLNQIEGHLPKIK